MRKASVFKYLVGLWLIWIAGWAYARPPLRICWESELKPPYVAQEPGSEAMTGIAVNLVNEIFSRAHIVTQTIVLPWKRCLLGVKEGFIDVAPNASYQSDRTEYALYTHPLYKTRLVLFYSQTKFVKPPQLKTVEDLARYVVGGVAGFNYEYYQGKVPLELNSHNRIALIRRLQLGRVDIATGQLEVFLSLAQQGKLDLNGLAYVADPVSPVENYYILVSKEYPGAAALVSFLNRGIAELQKDGTEKKIYEKYKMKLD